MDETILKYAVDGINAQLGDIKAELQAIRRDIKEHPMNCPQLPLVKAQGIDLKEHESRIRCLEKWRWVMTGAAAAAGGAIGSLLG